MINRSTTFRNWRMFPVHCFCCRALIALASNVFFAIPCSPQICSVKYSTSNGISSTRSLSAGTAIGMTFRRWNKSSRKLPSAISFCRFLFVAANTRTFTLIALSDPTRVISLSCSARSTFVCAARLISPISSKNSVPPSACSNLPARSLTAPVNEPFICPNNSLSINSLGIAAQFTSTIGPFARAEPA